MQGLVLSNESEFVVLITRVSSSRLYLKRTYLNFSTRSLSPTKRTSLPAVSRG